MASFYAAINSGADAVYLGGKEFSARASAQNFTAEEMAKAVSYAHVRGKRVFVTLNILLSDEECERALNYAADLYEMGVDALIVQDIGFAELVSKYLPGFELHASTQMSVMDLEGARYLEKMGFSRVVVGREISPDEIRRIKEGTDLEIEAFCHGALCVSISGQCEMSSYIGARSGNRGNCAQPCRKQYTIEDAEGNSVYDKGYVISPRDLNTIQFVDRLAEAGVYSFKLEGRMKSPEYVAVVTSNYNKALGGEDFKIEDMAQMFNRSYTKGVGFGDFGDAFITKSRPNHRGVKIGVVVNSDLAKGTTVDWKRLPDEGDLLEFTVAGEKKRHTFAGKAEEALRLPFAPDAGTTVLRLSSVKLNEAAARESEEIAGTRDVSGHFYAHIGELPRFTLKGDHRSEAVGEDPLERAKKAKANKDHIRENLGKFDGSVYALKDVELDMDDDVFLPISTVNDLRRRALADYEKKDERTRPDFTFSESFRKKTVEKTLLTVEISEEEAIYDLPYRVIDRLELYFLPSKEAMAFLKGVDVPVYYSFPYETPAGYDKVKNFFDGGVVQNLGQFEDVSGHIVAGEGLNVFNAYSFRHFHQAESIIPSFECKRQQLEALYRRFGTCGEILYYGYPRSMTMRHCPMSLVKGCGVDRKCATCAFRKNYRLRDERNAAFPFRRIGDMTEIYNSVPIYLGDRAKSIMAMKPAALKIRGRVGEDLNKIIMEASRVIEGKPVKKPVVSEFTRGHFNRGII